MTKRELADVDDVDAEYEREPESLLDALREEWTLWAIALVAVLAAVLAATRPLTASPFDQYMFGAIAAVVVLAAAGRTISVSDRP